MIYYPESELDKTGKRDASGGRQTMPDIGTGQTRIGKREKRKDEDGIETVRSKEELDNRTFGARTRLDPDTTPRLECCGGRVMEQELG